MKYWYVYFSLGYGNWRTEYSNVVAGESFDAVTQHVLYGKPEYGTEKEWSGHIIFTHEISKKEYDRLCENLN
jgi:hypothetical protein